MRYGDKKARYAVLDYNGNLREVVGAVFGSSKVEYTKPDSLVEVKNNGTSNSITIIDTGSDGSYIIKNSNKSVDNWGWTNGTAEVTIPSNATIWTHGQHSDHNHNIITGNNGQFEVVDWNNCTGNELDQGFNQAKAIKIVPNSWPKSITTLYKTLAGITLDNIPNWNNAAPVTDIRELFNGTVINGDLKIDGMIANLTNATRVSKLLNNLVINNYLNSPDEYKFYYLYKMLSNKVSGTNSAACFGGYQYSSGNYNPSYNYAVKFKFTDVNGQTANVIPPDLMYIPKEWGGFLDSTYGYVDVVSFTNSSLKVNADRHIEWTLASNYYTIKQSDGNWIVENFRDFYTSSYCVAEIDYDYNGQHYHYAYVFRRNNHEVTFSSLIPQVECTIKLHMYMALPDSTTSPRIVDGQINTDYQEVFMELNDPHRGEDGVYTTIMIPEETDYDITTCTITIDTCSQGDSNITWKVYDSDNKRIDNGARPPENYIVTLSNDTNTYTYGTNTRITSALIPLYNIADGICIDESGSAVINIPDGNYTINVKAYKDENYCETTSPITIKNWVDFRTGVDIIPDMVAASNGIFKWTVNKDGVSVMNSYQNADFWTWKYNKETGEWDGYNTGVSTPTTDTIIDLSGEKHPDGKYRISMRVRSKYDQYSVYPTKKGSDGNFFVWEITKSSAIVYSTGERGVFIPVTFKQDTVITNYSVLTSNNNQGAPGAAIFDELGFMLSKSSSLSGGAESREITVNDGTETIKTGYIWTATPTNTITCKANKTYYFIISPYNWGTNNTVYKYYNKSNHSFILPSSEDPSNNVFNKLRVLPVTTDYIYCGESATQPENPVEKGMYIDTVSNYHLKWGSTSEYCYGGIYYVYYENGIYTYLCKTDGTDYNGYVTEYINNSYKITDKYYIEINGEIS